MTAKAQPQQNAFPPVSLYNGGRIEQSTVYGKSPDGSKVLLHVNEPMTEKHLNGGLIRSQAPMVDDRGQPKRVTAYRFYLYCPKHQTAWQGDGSCPVCSAKDDQK